jgi:Mg2+ and Co2+ transporter CorA
MILFSRLIWTNNSTNNAKRSSNSVIQFTKFYGLEVGVNEGTKTAILWIDGGRNTIANQNKKFNIGNQNIPICSKYKYLGIIIAPNLDFTDEFKYVKKAINQTTRILTLCRDYSEVQVKTIMNALIYSIIQYRQHVLQFTNQQLEELEQIVEKAVKNTFGIAKNLPHEIIFGPKHHSTQPIGLRHICDAHAVNFLTGFLEQTANKTKFPTRISYSP